MSDPLAMIFKYGLARFRAAQCYFLLSIERHVPAVLDALRTSVLPVWRAGRRERPSGPELAPATYPAIWEWAKGYNLIEAKDLDGLKAVHPVSIRKIGDLCTMLNQATPAESFMEEFVLASRGWNTDDSTLNWLSALSPMNLPGMPDPGGFRCTIPQPFSSALVFGMAGLAPVVIRTLEAWSVGPDLRELRWTFPAGPQLIESVALAAMDAALSDRFPEGFQLIQGAPGRGMDGVLSDLVVVQPRQRLKNFDRESFARGTNLPGPPTWEYESKVLAWLIHRESRADAKRRILKEFERELDQKMNEHQHIAELTSHYRPGRIINEKHFDWLALFQAGGKTKYEIAKIVAEQDGKTRSKTPEKTVSKGIKTAAEHVIGPQWASWLKRVPPGRPKRS
jgi:hypothetical protein